MRRLSEFKQVWTVFQLVQRKHYPLFSRQSFSHISSIYLVPSNGCQSSQYPLLTSIFRVTQFSSRHWILLPFSTPLWSSVLSNSKFRLHLHINFIAFGIGTVVVYSVLSNETNDIFSSTPTLIKPRCVDLVSMLRGVNLRHSNLVSIYKRKTNVGK